MRPLLFAAALLLSCSSLASAQEPLVRLAGVQRTDGPQDEIALRRVLAISRAGFRACQERRVADGARVEGRLTIVVVTGPDGLISSAEVTQRTFEPDGPLEACILSVLRRARVPVADAPSTFIVGLILGVPGDAPPATPAPADEATRLRAEVLQARDEARCLNRAARRLERVLTEWELAGPARRQLLATRIAEARAARSMCSGGIASLLGGLPSTGLGPTDPSCPGCRSAAP